MPKLLDLPERPPSDAPCIENAHLVATRDEITEFYASNDRGPGLYREANRTDA